jgi:hypothetical protein
VTVWKPWVAQRTIIMNVKKGKVRANALKTVAIKGLL